MSPSTPTWNPNLYNDKHAFVFAYGEQLLQWLNPQKGEHILDLGCGAGQLTYQINQLGAEVVGMDQSSDMIAKAQSLYPSINFLVGDAVDFSFEEKFDAIFSNATLHWVLSYQKAIQAMYANLKSGGRLVVEFGGKGNVQLIETTLKETLAKHGYLQQSQIQLWYFPSIGEYSSALEKVGFRVTFAQHFDRPTALADEATGIKDWLAMFGGKFFDGVSLADQEIIMEEVQEILRPTLFTEGKWYADYKRLRIMAFKD
ncbi:methyltransferase domain-containing protein [Echinicola sp. CAU 1574]|uniref:Methyltransferase domain-containing protein n=1 Tax=Echinicola arenosa TaxID=2774144 RepID=A0ABR9APH9_9BACT|nr:class I SAM-dependent methyltransferase [Echinicola arenosa]MBD8489815.1 methyltransferase domain-containing protein [Echinicola arenosa]